MSPAHTPELDDTIVAPSVTTTGARDSVVPSFSPERLAGRYELVSLLGSGGMGSVYRARDLTLDEMVALKVLRDELAGDAAMLARFRQEVRLARKVTHCNVARTFDIGVHGDRMFLTMELIEGHSLASVLEHEGPPPMKRILEIVSSVCAGLAAAHAASIVHRDLKPDNVLLANDGRVVITDFGIARAYTEVPLPDTAGTAIGTPAYMAPEQVEARPDLDARADIYALGAILYELFTGSQAWEGPTAAVVVARRLLEPPPDPRSVRPELSADAARLTMRCMARDPADRFQSVDEVLHAVGALEAIDHAPRSAPVRAASAAVKTVAVVPFRNSGEPGDQYLADGLTDDLIDVLSMTDGVRVSSRGLVMARETRDSIALGRELKVQAVVEGSIRRERGRLQVRARVVSVEDGFQLWAKRLDQAEAEFFQLSDTLARAVAHALTCATPAAPREAPEEPVAIDLYLRARHEFHKGWRENVARAVELYEQALARMPDHAMILSGYAMALGRRASFDDTTPERIHAARVAAERALEKAPHSAPARVARAYHHMLGGESALAAEGVRDVLETTPGSVDALDLSGRMLGEAGPVEEGIRRMVRGLELEPALLATRYEIARLYALVGDREASEAFFREPPGQPGITSLYWMNRCRVAMWEKDVTRAKEWLASLEPQRATGAIAPPVYGMLATLLGQEPPRSLFDYARGESARTGQTPRRRAFFGLIVTEWAAFIGEDEIAFEGLDNADAGLLFDVVWLERSPTLARLRSHPRFRAVYERVSKRAAAVRGALRV